MSTSVHATAKFQFVSVVLTPCARRDFISDYCSKNLGSDEQDAEEVLQHHIQHHGEDGDTFLLSLLAIEFIAGRKKSKKDEPSTFSSPATTIVTIK